MTWPTSHDYLEALQHPLRRFCRPELRRGQAACGFDGKPRMWTGKRLDVCEAQAAGGVDRWAIGCFTQEPTGVVHRFLHINQHLQQNSLPSVVETDYIDQGICIRGRWYPIVRSHWVPGLPLDAFVGENVDQPEDLRALACAWVKLAQELRRGSFAHGNLCCDTVLVIPGTERAGPRLQLVDYDAVFVPALEGTPPEEMGHGAFQHPERLAQNAYNAEIDRFAHLVIYTALRALAVGGKALWQRFGECGTLLFRETDWNEPGTSGVLQTLWRLPDEAVQNLVGQVILASQGNLADVPLLEQVVDGSALNSAARDRIDCLLGAGLPLNLTIDEDSVEDTGNFDLIVDDDPTCEAITKPIANLPRREQPLPCAEVLDPNLRVFQFDAWMPERIAVMKLEGFARDGGGEIIQSEPGHIRMQMIDEKHLAAPTAPGLLTWLGLAEQLPATPRVLAVIDLFLAHKPLAARKMIGITVQMSPGPGQDPGERWKPYCERVFCELRAYLVGYQ